MRDTNVKDIIILAEQGNLAAQADLGERYYKGIGVEQNYAEAVKWFCKAAQPYIELCSLEKNRNVNDNTADACYEMYEEPENELRSASWAAYWLGECYLHGYGVEKNISKTIELWEFAAEKIDGVLMELANLYSNGIEFEPNYIKAVYWWKRAAHLDYAPNRGFPEARYELGVCYYEGKGVEKDIQKAIEYFDLAIEEAPMFSEIEIKSNAFIEKIHIENG